MQWSLSDKNLYNIAYEWTQHRKIDNWSARDVVSGKNFNKRCTEISYETAVKVPRFFLAYIVAQEKTAIKKRVCVEGALMHESIHVQRVPFIETMHIEIHGRVANDKTYLSAETEIILPWFLEILRDRIEKHVSKSLQEYLQILPQYACTTGPKLVSKRRPQQTYQDVK